MIYILFILQRNFWFKYFHLVLVKWLVNNIFRIKIRMSIKRKSKIKMNFRRGSGEQRLYDKKFSFPFFCVCVCLISHFWKISFNIFFKLIIRKFNLLNFKISSKDEKSFCKKKNSKRSIKFQFSVTVESFFPMYPLFIKLWRSFTVSRLLIGCLRAELPSW